MKKTKIICTMGPNSDDRHVLQTLMEKGMDIARVNFSHGTHEEQKAKFDSIKELREKVGKPIAILLDTKGPEIRTGRLKDGTVTLQEGQDFILTSEEIMGDETRVSQTYPQLAEDVKPGSTILIDDGLIELTVKEVRNGDILCRVINGGKLGQQKGINLPGISVKLPAITEKDKEDILFGLDQGIDFIAASFVRNKEAIEEIRKLLVKKHAENVNIIAKIENQEGIDNIDSIIEASDGIMVARGDMGVEIPAYEVPQVQKMIIKKCNASYKPVIVATQMLDSMIHNPRPTRAEVTDVANAIREGTDAIMLSGETAMGKYPVEALEMMVKIAETTEQNLADWKLPKVDPFNGTDSISGAVGIAAVATAVNLKAECIVTPTMAGLTAKMMSHFRPGFPVYAVTPNEWAQRRMQIYWGITPLLGRTEDSSEHMIVHAMEIVKKKGFVKRGDIVVLTAGDPATNEVRGKGAASNTMHVIEAK